MTYTCTIETPLGPMTAAAEGSFLTGLWFVGQKLYPLEASQWTRREGHPVFKWLRLYLSCYFARKVGNHDFPLAPEGSRLQQRVWQVLAGIPYGKTLSHAAVAREVAHSIKEQPTSPLAIERAITQNPISILIPSHRVLSPDGSLAGYAAGAEKKEALLRVEGVFPGECMRPVSPLGPPLQPAALQHAEA